MRLKDRTAIITGANRGLGEAIASAFLREGAHLLLVARDETLLQRVCEGLLERRSWEGQYVDHLGADVSRVTDIEAIKRKALNLFPDHIDILVNNAGIYGPMGSIEDVDWDEWISTVQVNLFGTVSLCRAIIPIMLQQGYGKIISLSGGGATSPLPRMSAYAVSKVAIVRFTETIAVELRGTGIDVNAIAPGALNTRLLAQALEAGPEKVGQDFYERSVRQKKDGGVPLEIPAQLAVFLSSPESDGITGRLISAVWDDWRSLPGRLDQLTDSDVYTLRRIVPGDRGLDWE